MRPLSFRPDALRVLLLHNKIATLDELKLALGTSVDVTVFRKLKPLDYLTSYSHRGRYYSLRQIARFDDHGLWSQEEVWFSRFGTLLATAEGFVHRSPRGYFADELAPLLHVEVQDALHQLAQQGRVSRQIVSGRYLYTAVDLIVQRRQLLARRTVEFLPTVVDPSVLEVAPEDARDNRRDRDSAGARHRRGSHHRVEVDPQDDREDRRGSAADRYPGLGQYGGSSALPNGFLSARQSQTDRHQL